MESEPVYAWQYELRSRSALNARAVRRSFPGALVRIGEGFGCLHPWPELGDPPLEDLLAALAAGDESQPLVNRARTCAAQDGLARQIGISSLERGGRGVPPSHATVPEWAAAAIEEAMERGFERIKLKAGANLDREALRLTEWAGRWPQLRWRLDFNAVPTREEVAQFLERVSPEGRRRIDFLEDPFTYDPAAWERFGTESGMRLALDRGVEKFAGGADVLVWKPALADGALVTGMAIAHELEVVATSYMDHPLGQCFAAAESGYWDRIGISGLQTHELFEANAFSEVLGPAGPRFVRPPGAGLGFDDLLESLPWKRWK